MFIFFVFSFSLLPISLFIFNKLVYEHYTYLEKGNCNTPNYTIVFFLQLRGIIKVKFVCFRNLSAKSEKR